ncbi:MAG: D-sedoheptulose-7-phosphate isomerase [Gammaproteobacteria bacterium]
MVNMNERIRTLFAHDIEGKISLVDILTDSIAHAGQRLVDCLLADGKIFICGQGASAANCLHFATAMLHCFAVERPSLPVINLATNSMIAVEHAQIERLFAQQIQALGHANDVLILLTTSGQSKALNLAVNAAHDKQMNVIALTGHNGGELVSHFNSHDIEIRIPSESLARIRAMHLFILHCFCDVIDRSLFGYDAEKI